MTDTNSFLLPERQYLAEQLTAVERCAYFALLTRRRIDWPLAAQTLQLRRLDAPWFEHLAALNERFAKLQDVLGAAMRHAAFLLAEPAPSFLHVLAFFEKHGVVASSQQWLRIRKMRNDAAHDYDIDPQVTAEHFNQIDADLPVLTDMARCLVGFCAQWLNIHPVDAQVHAAFEALATA